MVSIGICLGTWLFYSHTACAFCAGRKVFRQKVRNIAMAASRGIGNINRVYIDHCVS